MTESLVCSHMQTVYMNDHSLSLAQRKELADKKISWNKANKILALFIRDIHMFCSLSVNIK